MKSVFRSGKNMLYGYTDVQVRLREATSNEPTGPTMSQMESLTHSTHNHSMLNEMIYIMDKRLNDHGKNWRHVYKTLVLLEYMICCGSDMAVNYARDRLYMIGTLKEFIHVDQHGFDQGGNVRMKSRDIVDLLSNEELLAQARATKSVPQLQRRGSEEPLTIANGSRGHVSQHQASAGSIRTPARQSYQDLQELDEDQALALALRESQEMHNMQMSKSRSKSLDPAQVYPNFLDNVSKASLARSSSSLTNNGLMATEGKQTTSMETLSKPANNSASLLDLSDEDFGRALDEKMLSGNPQKQRSQSIGSQDLSALYALNVGNQNFVGDYQENPFANANYNPAVEVDPFNSLSQARHMSLPINMDRTSCPIPLAPGQVPVNHVSVAGGYNVGAKPVMPHQVAPQYGYTHQQQGATNQMQSNHEEDPFAQL